MPEWIIKSDGEAKAQLLPDFQAVVARPAEESARPTDFANASPFPRRKKEHDAAWFAALIAAAIAFLAFLGSMIAVLMMHAPR